MKYHEATIEFSKSAKGGIERKVRFQGGVTEGRDPLAVPQGIDLEALYRDWLATFRPSANPPSISALGDARRLAGEALFAATFPPSTDETLRQFLTAIDTEGHLNPNRQDARGLRLRYILGPGFDRGSERGALLPAASLPWELISDPRAKPFLARRRAISIVRTIGTPGVPLSTQVSGKLRVLVANAAPQGAAALAWQGEVAQILNALKDRTETHIEVIEHANFQDTMRQLREGVYHVFHFIGHGDYDPVREQRYLLFELEGQKEPVYADDLADRLSELPALRLAVLNACRSGELDEGAWGNPLSGVAAALSAYGVPAVIAMQIPVTDPQAIQFSGEFYSVLRQSGSIETALSAARQVVRLSSPEWATPVLYLRDASSDLFEFNREVPGPTERGEGTPELKLGIRTFVKSPKFPHFEAWAKNLDEETENLLALEGSFDGRFIRDPEGWATSILPRLDSFFSDALDTGRPLGLQLVAHSTVAFAAGYSLPIRAEAPISLVQRTARGTETWSERKGPRPSDSCWAPFEVEERDPNVADIAVAIAITNEVAPALAHYLSVSPLRVGRIIQARIAGEPGKTRVESGAHAHTLATQLHQYLKDHTGNRTQRRLHLFIAAPNAFVFYFGQLARSLGQVQLYEYDFEAAGHGTYEPSLALPIPAAEEAKA